MSFSNVGQRWSTSSFPSYLASLGKPPAWADSVCIHHTAAPSLAQRPNGFTAQHIENIRDFYKRQYGWNRGPHLFTDEDDIFGMTPLSMPGIHAASFNSRAIGIEALGAFDTEDPLSGRGLEVMQTTASATRALFDWLGIKPTSKNLLFHRFDPKTTKTCPGTKVRHDWFLDLVLAATPGAARPLAETDTGGLTEVPRVSVVQYISDKTGMKASELAKMIRRDEAGLFYLGEQWLEDAVYSAEIGSTMVSVAEADEAAAVLTKPSSDENMVPVVANIASKFGITFEQAVNNLKTVGGVFQWRGQTIAGAQYDRSTQTTIAPLSSIQQLK